MKLTKKLLAAFGIAALLATSMVFTSCGEDDDDENEMLAKDDSDNFNIAYTNDTGAVSRGYKTTTNKHSGALVKVTMSKDSKNAGAMGYIWDLESNSSREAKEPRRFCIVGFNYDGSQVNPYISVYKNVTDIQLRNFGATETTAKENGANTDADSTATEVEILALNAGKFDATYDADNKNVVLTIDVYEDGNFTWNEKKTKRVYTDEKSGNEVTKHAYSGGYKIDIYAGEVTTEQIADGSVTAKKSATITYDKLGYDENTQPKQQTCAAYANVYAGSTLTGTWQYLTTYHNAEVIEDAE